jgi:predicted exporter
MLGRIWQSIAGLPRPLWPGIAAAAACMAYLALSPRPLWEDSLGGLTPVPQALLERDSALRRELGAPDMRHLLVIEGADAQSVLEKSAALEPELDSMIARGQLAGFDSPSRYLPPASVQERRRAALPGPDELTSALADASRGVPFKPGVFEPFLADVEHARKLPALVPSDLAGTPLESRVDSLLLQRADHWTGLVTLTGLNDPTALEQVLPNQSGVTLLDLKQASEDLVAHQRERILWCLAISAVMLVIVVFVALRDAGRVRRVLAPMALTTLVIVALFHAAGISLSLFHLIALVLAAGLGLDYALFFEHASNDPAQQRRTLHAIVVCSLSTFMVFALLGLSSLPVLRAIGLTVAAGVMLNFVLALLLTRTRGPANHGC